MRKQSDIGARGGELAAVLGGALWAAKAFYDRNDAPPWPTDITDDLSFVVPLLFAAGSLGLYARCRGSLDEEWRRILLGASIVGSVGFLASAAGLITMALEAGPRWWLEASWMMFVFGLFMGNLGLVFSGVSALEGRLLGHSKSLPLALSVLGILLILIGDPPNSELGVYPTLALWMLYGLGWAALGCVLLAGAGSVTRSPAAAEMETSA